MGWERYAIYWLPGGDLGALGAAWLGWDARRGQAMPGMVTAPKARSYGFHATLKPPFRLAEGRTEADLQGAARDIAAGLAPADLGALRVDLLGPFAALRPQEPQGIRAIAGRFVQGLDGFRAPPTVAELARRRASGLTPAQEAYLDRWGYPYVFDEFRPHVTLSGPDADQGLVAQARAHFADVTDGSIQMDAVSLVGQAPDGLFHLIEDLPLGAARAG